MQLRVWVGGVGLAHWDKRAVHLVRVHLQRRFVSVGWVRVWVSLHGLVGLGSVGSVVVQTVVIYKADVKYVGLVLKLRNQHMSPEKGDLIPTSIYTYGMFLVQL